MAVTASWYGLANTHFVQGQIAYLTDTIKVALVSSSYVFNQDTHETYADIAASDLATGNGYTIRGLALGTKTVTYDATTNRSRLKAASSVWTPSAGQTLSAAGAVIYKDTGTNATSWLMGYVNFGGSVSAYGASFTINWDTTDGLLVIAAV